MLSVEQRGRLESYYGVHKSAPDAPIVLINAFYEDDRQINEWVAVVVRCPYCGDEHSHPVCVGHADPFGYLGGRYATCSFRTGVPSRYNLVAVNGWPFGGDPSGDQWEWLDRHFPLIGMPVRPVPVKREAITPDLRADVWDKSRGICWYCGGELHPFRNFHVDHILPVVDGGTNDLGNLVPCCQSCNTRKGPRPAEYLRRFIGSGVFWFEKEGRA